MLSKLEEIHRKMKNEKNYLENVTKEYIEFLNGKYEIQEKTAKERTPDFK